MKRWLLACMAVFTVMYFCTFITAEAMSLDDVINSNEENNSSETDSDQSESTGNNTNGNGNNIGGSYIDNLTNTTDMSEQTELATTVTSKLQPGVTAAVQIIMYIAVAALTLRVALDLLYIAAPFLRGILANGRGGNMQQNNSVGGYNNNSMTGYNNNGMHGYNTGMNGYNSTGMNGYNNNGMGQTQQSNPLSGIQLVSNAAFAAVEAEKTMGANGKPVGPFKIYSKDMFVMLIAVPVLLVLAVTGTLTNFGFLVGRFICKFIGGISF